MALTTKTLTHHLAFYEISVFPSALDVIFSLDLGPAPLPNSMRTLLTRKKGREYDTNAVKGTDAQMMAD